MAEPAPTVQNGAIQLGLDTRTDSDSNNMVQNHISTANNHGSNGSFNNGFLRLNSNEPYKGDYDAIMSNGAETNGHSNGVTKPNMSPVPSYNNLEESTIRPRYRKLIDRLNDRIARNEKFFSLEFFPPRTLPGLSNFLTRLDRLNEGGPLFVDVTWHLGSDPGSDKETSSSSVASACLNYCLIDTMLHITCAQYTKQQSLAHLKRCKDLGIRNILALRGDLPDQDPNKKITYEFKAVDLVKWIREEYGDYFTIAVAGYPSGHPDSPTYSDDLANLKAKCDAGADFIVTQLFFETSIFEKFVHDCREVGIKVPIVPGILPIQSYDNIKRVCQLSKLDIPQDVLAAIEPIRHNDEAVRNFGIQYAVNQCRRLLDSGLVPSVHIYTLNRENAARDILKQVGLWKTATIRQLPYKFQGTQHPSRCREDVRPIFWSSRPKSYVYRTKDWDDFPNGRWGDQSSPAFGDLRDYHLFSVISSTDEKLKMWGSEITVPEDVYEVFRSYISGTTNKNGVKVTRLPWSEVDLQGETMLLKEQLIWCNENGILTINSQPNVNGAPSTDPLVGWGSPGGYCYQKAYLEFFISNKHKSALMKVLSRYPRVSYHVIEQTGDGITNDSHPKHPNAVTWGVFPGQEIIQPTVVDPQAFTAWRDEAYELWLTEWAKLYPEDSESYKNLKQMHDTFCLVNLVDNDFPQTTCLWQLLADVLEESNQ